MTELVIVSGLSGSGKSTVLRALEDLGWFCIDNLPVLLLPRILTLMADQSRHRHLAVVVDARDQEHIEEAGEVIDEIRSAHPGTRVLFVEARDEHILRRFRETRRPHPLESGHGVQEAVRQEREKLLGLRSRADLQVDTSALNVHQLKDRIRELISDVEGRPLHLTLTSFGFKRGLPDDADLVFDVRFLENPHFIPELRAKNGLDAEVAEFVRALDDSQTFLAHLLSLLDFLLPRYRREGKSYLTLAIGCTGGKHRSVALTEALAEALEARGHVARTEHRDRAYWS